MLITLSLATGCWDRKEVLDIAIVMITSLDTGDKPGSYSVHTHIADPKKLFSPGQTAQGKGRPIEHIVMEGKNLDGIRMGMERMLPRDFVSSHRRVFVVGEALARQGIKDALDRLIRNPNNRLNTLIIVADNARGDELVDLQATLETFNADVFREIVGRKAFTPSSLKDYYIASTTPGQQPIAASFTRTKQGKIILSGIAVFNNHKLVGFVKGKEASLLTGLLGKKTMNSFSVSYPGVEESVSIQLDRMNVHHKVDTTGAKPEITFDVKVYGRVMENLTNLDLSEPGILKKLNQAFDQELERSFVSLFGRLQKDFRTDSAGLGAMIYREDPKYWKRMEKEWPELYPEQKIVWKIESKITGVGTMGAPLHLPEEEVQK